MAAVARGSARVISAGARAVMKIRPGRNCSPVPERGSRPGPGLAGKDRAGPGSLGAARFQRHVSAVAAMFSTVWCWSKPFT